MTKLWTQSHDLMASLRDEGECVLLSIYFQCHQCHAWCDCPLPFLFRVVPSEVAAVLVGTPCPPGTLWIFLCFAPLLMQRLDIWWRKWSSQSHSGGPCISLHTRDLVALKVAEENVSPGSQAGSKGLLISNFYLNLLSESPIDWVGVEMYQAWPPSSHLFDLQ